MCRSYAWSLDSTTRCSPRRPPATARYLPGSSRGCRSTSARAQSWPELVTRFAALCTKHGKVAGVLLGEHSAAPLYQSLGMKFIGIGSDLMVMMEPAAAAIDRQRVNTSHDWSPAPLNCAVDKTRSDAFWELLRLHAPFAGSILTDGGYEAMRAVRPAPVVLVDCFREGLNTPTALSHALRSLDGQGIGWSASSRPTPRIRR